MTSGLSRDFLLAAGLALVASVATPAALTIEHEPVGCLTAGEYPLIDACLEPADGVARARVYFRAGDTRDWYYVDMARKSRCFRGVLPRPSESTRRIDYYVSATDPSFEEVRTPEYETSVIGKGSGCDGVLAPYVSTASVIVGSVAGAAFPAGFVGGSALGATAVAGIVATGAVAGVGIVEGGENEESPPTTTTPPSEPTPTPTPEPTPVPPPSACLPDDSDPPEVTILEPRANADVGATVEIVAEVVDPGPASSGIAGVRMFAEEQGGSRTVEIATPAPPGPLYRATWSLPECMGPQDRWYIHVQATDRCGRAGGARVRVKRRGDSCASTLADGEGEASVLWTSDLDVSGGKGQVVVDGAHVLFPDAGSTALLLPAGSGPHRVEAVLVSGEGEEGFWRFALAAGPARVERLRVVAGEAVAVGPDLLAFRLQGRAGERVVFVYDVQ